MKIRAILQKIVRSRTNNYPFLGSLLLSFSPCPPCIKMDVCRAFPTYLNPCRRRPIFITLEVEIHSRPANMKSTFVLHSGLFPSAWSAGNIRERSNFGLYFLTEQFESRPICSPLNYMKSLVFFKYMPGWKLLINLGMSSAERREQWLRKKWVFRQRWFQPVSGNCSHPVMMR